MAARAGRQPDPALDAVTSAHTPLRFDGMQRSRGSGGHLLAAACVTYFFVLAAIFSGSSFGLTYVMLNGPMPCTSISVGFFMSQ